MTKPQKNDFAWSRGSTDPFVMTFANAGGTVSDVRLRVFSEDGNHLAFQSVKDDGFLARTSIFAQEFTFTPDAAHTNALSPNASDGEPRNYYTVEIKVGTDPFREVLSGSIYGEGGPDITLTLPGGGGAGPQGPAGADGNDGAPGAAGAAGRDGSAALAMKWRHTTDVGDIDSGYVGVNNATPGSATELRISLLAPIFAKMLAQNLVACGGQGQVKVFDAVGGFLLFTYMSLAISGNRAIFTGYVQSDSGTLSYADNSDVFVAMVATQMPNDINIFKSGKPAADEILFQMNVTRPFLWESGLPGSIFKALTAATATYVATIKKGGSSIGTLSWAAAGTTPTLTFASDTTFAVNDVISIVGQSTPDATLANLVLNFKGSR